MFLSIPELLLPRLDIDAKEKAFIERYRFVDKHNSHRI
jgi:hypothetical protein